jgi:hypothetical protein
MVGMFVNRPELELRFAHALGLLTEEQKAARVQRKAAKAAAVIECSLLSQFNPLPKPSGTQIRPSKQRAMLTDELVTRDGNGSTSSSRSLSPSPR